MLRGFPRGTSRASPVARRILAAMPSLTPRRNLRAHMPVLPAGTAFAPVSKSSASGIMPNEATFAFTFVTAWQLAHRPRDGFVDGLQTVDYSSVCRPSYTTFGFCHGWSILQLDALALSGRTMPAKKRKPRGPRPGSEIAMKLTVGHPIEAPMGPEWSRFPASGKARWATEPGWSAVPSSPQAAVQQTCPGPRNGLGPLKGAGDVVAIFSQAPISPPAMHPAPFMYGLGGWLALEMAWGRREMFSMWLRHFLRPQNPRLLCFRLRS